MVDVVELLRASTDQVPNARHLRILHTFSSVTSLAFLIQQDIEAPARRRGDGDGEVISVGLRLSTTKI